ncbi:MAG: GH1 family beta-glucosidase [Thermodesulfobacteriota bacterium]
MPASKRLPASRVIQPPPTLHLPPDFLWGASTAAYQIEGAAAEDGRGASIWDIHCRMPGRVANGDTGDVACDHYHRYEEDIGLMREIGIKAYRFSISWPRVLPRGRGAVNEKGLDFYDRLIDGLLAAGIEPWLCLYHWDLPQSLDDLGGWTSRDVAGWFADYATIVARRYGDRVKRFATFNEPSVSTFFGYAMNWNAPGASDRTAYLRAAHHLNLAHGRGVAALRAHVAGVKIGAIHNCQPVFPENNSKAARHAAALFDEHWNLIYADPQNLGHYPPHSWPDFEPYVQAGDLDTIHQPADWFGINHYGPIYAKADPASQLGFGWGASPPAENHPVVGWPIHPWAFRDELLRVSKRYGLPVYVTENGCGGRDRDSVDKQGRVIDPHRIAFLGEYTESMAEAIRRGADVRGYFVWSFLDNFEWGAGFADRFGLVFVDYANRQRRILKESGRWYAELIRRNSAPGRPKKKKP